MTVMRMHTFIESRECDSQSAVRQAVLVADEPQHEIVTGSDETRFFRQIAQDVRQTCMQTGK